MDTETTAGREGRREGYVAQAEHAEQQAAGTADPMVRRTWQSIADGYRELARLAVTSHV